MLKTKGSIIIIFILFLGIAKSQTKLNMELLGSMNKYADVGYSAIWGYTAPNGREYALLGVRSGTSIVDITKPDSLKEIAFIPGPNSIWRELKAYSNYAYVVTEAGGGMQIIDLSNLPNSATLVKTYTTTFTSAHTISIEGKYLYINGSRLNGQGVGGIIILDLTDPLNPVKVGEYSTRYIHDCYVRNDTIYAAAGSTLTLDIIDAKNKSNLKLLASYVYAQGYAHNAWTTEDGKYVATTDEIGTAQYIRILNIQNLNNISIVSQYRSDDQSIPHNVHIRGNFAYISHYTSGVRIVDISDPTAPVEVGYYDTSTISGGFAGVWEVYNYFPSGKIIASDMENGLYVFSFNGTKAGKIQGNIIDKITSEKIPSVKLNILETGNIFYSDLNGSYRIGAPQGNYNVKISIFDIPVDTIQINIQSSTTKNMDINLNLGMIQASVKDKNGNNISGVNVRINELNIENKTDLNGNSSLKFLPSKKYSLKFSKFGYLVNRKTVDAIVNQTSNLNVVLETGIQDEFEYDYGWKIGDTNDNATNGIWERAITNGTSAGVGTVQPDTDHTVDGKFAFVTGNAAPGAGALVNNVDGGKTTLFSPVFDVTSYINPVIAYYRWYSNNALQTAIDDTFIIDISNDDGINWKNLEKISITENMWKLKQFSLKQIGITPTNKMKLRFIASDYGKSSVVEAGIDDFAVTEGFISDVEDRNRLTAKNYILYQNYPNPFTTKERLNKQNTTISYTIPEISDVKITVYNILGQAVVTLLSERQNAGNYNINWDGRNNKGRLVTSGIYFYRLEAKTKVGRKFADTKKITLVR